MGDRPIHLFPVIFGAIMLVLYLVITVGFISKTRNSRGGIRGDRKTRLALFASSLCLVLFGMIVGFNVICSDSLEVSIDALGALSFSFAILFMLTGSDYQPWVTLRRKVFFWVAVEEEVSERARTRSRLAGQQ